MPLYSLPPPPAATLATPLQPRGVAARSVASNRANDPRDQRGVAWRGSAGPGQCRNPIAGPPAGPSPRPASPHPDATSQHAAVRPHGVVNDVSGDETTTPSAKGPVRALPRPYTLSCGGVSRYFYWQRLLLALASRNSVAASPPAPLHALKRNHCRGGLCDVKGLSPCSTRAGPWPLFRSRPAHVDGRFGECKRVLSLDLCAL